MPNNPDYKAFRKIISQLPDVDAPYFFSLPDNIERSLQRTNSSILIKQLRVLSSSNAESAKYDREVWRTQVCHLCLSQTTSLSFITVNSNVRVLLASWGLFWSCGSN